MKQVNGKEKLRTREGEGGKRGGRRKGEEINAAIRRKLEGEKAKKIDVFCGDFGTKAGGRNNWREREDESRREE